MARESLQTQLFGGFINAGIRGINSFINKRADELHAQQAPQLARYNKYINDYIISKFLRDLKLRKSI